MVTNFVTGILPNSLRVSGNIYAIRSDFRIWMRFSEIMDSSDSEGRKIIQMLQACYPKIPEDLPGAIEQMIWFYRCGEAEEQEEEKKDINAGHRKSLRFLFPRMHLISTQRSKSNTG